MNEEKRIILSNQLLLFDTNETKYIKECIICSQPVEDHKICLCGWKEDPYIKNGFSHRNHKLLQKAKEEWKSK